MFVGMTITDYNTVMIKPILHVVAASENLATMRGFIHDRAVYLGVFAERIAGLILAVDEAVSNVILHGYSDLAGPLEIEMIAIPKQRGIKIMLRDWAIAHDPTQVVLPDELEPSEQHIEGGMGLFIISKSIDEISYRIMPDGGNELTLIKNEVLRNPMQIRTIVNDKGFAEIGMQGALDAHTANTLDDEIQSAFGKGDGRRLLLNFTDVDFVSSAGLRIVLKAQSYVRKNDGELRLFGLNSSIYNIFEITGLHKVLTIAETREQAMSDNLENSQ